MGIVIFGLLLVLVIIAILGYAIVCVAQGRDLPVHYFTIPLAIIVGMFVMSLLRGL